MKQRGRFAHDASPKHTAMMEVRLASRPGWCIYTQNTTRRISWSNTFRAFRIDILIWRFVLKPARPRVQARKRARSRFDWAAYHLQHGKTENAKTKCCSQPVGAVFASRHHAGYTHERGWARPPPKPRTRRCVFVATRGLGSQGSKGETRGGRVLRPSAHESQDRTSCSLGFSPDNRQWCLREQHLATKLSLPVCIPGAALSHGAL